MEIHGDDDEGTVKEGSDGGGIQHGTENEDDQADFLLQGRPVEGIVDVLRGLRGKNDVGIATGTVLQSTGKTLAVCCFVVQQDRSRNMRKVSICTSAS